METQEEKRNLAGRIRKIQESLKVTEKILMERNVVIGDLLEERYHDRMGFNKDGSFSRDGKVVWPERMVEDADSS